MHRRTFLSHSLLAAAQPAPRFDTLLKNARVIDPANNRNAKLDVAITAGKIAQVAPNIPATAANKTIDLANYYLTPGLIDLHICCFHTRLDLTPSVIADHHCLPSGVTTCCDGGTAGADSFPEFLQIINKSKTRILSFLNIAAPGAQANRAEQDPTQFKIDLAVQTAKAHPKHIIGFKTGHYSGKFSEARPAWASIDAVEEAGRQTSLPVLADFIPTPASPYREFLLEKLRPNDIVTHCLADRYPIFIENNILNPDIKKARARGVKFDLGHAGGSFAFPRVIPAIQQGFLPDSISADLFSDTPYTIGINLANVMSKFLALGVPLEEIIRRTTTLPAKMVQRPDLGNLSIGAPADLAAFELQSGKFAFRGSAGTKINGNQRLQCVLTLSAGKVLYDHPYALA